MSLNTKLRRFIARRRVTTLRFAPGLEPWTPQWARYCSYRYRSFDPSSGTFIGNDGREHFCTAG